MQLWLHAAQHAKHAAAIFHIFLKFVDTLNWNLIIYKLQLNVFKEPNFLRTLKEESVSLCIWYCGVL